MAEKFGLDSNRLPSTAVDRRRKKKLRRRWFSWVLFSWVFYFVSSE
jgi:hypothetical protein